MHIIVYVTAPDEKIGRELARALVENRLAACVNMTSPITSTYWWEDKVQEENERLLIIKTKLQLFEELECVVRRIHPYSVPEIIGIPILCGSRAYMDWISNETRCTLDDPGFRSSIF